MDLITKRSFPFFRLSSSISPLIFIDPLPLLYPCFKLSLPITIPPVGKSGLDRYSTEIVLQGFNSTFKILSSKNSQIENLQDSQSEKSSLPDDKGATSNDLDDEIPF